MKAFQVETAFSGYQKHIVIADTMAEAEKAFMKEYWPTTIRSIRLDADYVIIAKDLLKEVE